jgi:hypothetical protein
LAVGWWGAFAPGIAHAQPPGSYTPPPGFSPYLNLLRTNVNPAINVYGLIGPQVNAANSIQNLQYQQFYAASQQQALANSLLPTGQGAGYQTQGRYFQNQRTGGVGGAAPAPAAATGAPALPAAAANASAVPR